MKRSLLAAINRQDLGRQVWGRQVWGRQVSGRQIWGQAGFALPVLLLGAAMVWPAVAADPLTLSGGDFLVRVAGDGPIRNALGFRDRADRDYAGRTVVDNAMTGNGAEFGFRAALALEDDGEQTDAAEARVTDVFISVFTGAAETARDGEPEAVGDVTATADAETTEDALGAGLTPGVAESDFEGLSAKAGSAYVFSVGQTAVGDGQGDGKNWRLGNEFGLAMPRGAGAFIIGQSARGPNPENPDADLVSRAVDPEDVPLVLDLGVQYKNGPWMVGGYYLAGEADNPTAGNVQEGRAYSLEGGYRFGPGIQIALGVQFWKYQDTGNPTNFGLMPSDTVTGDSTLVFLETALDF